MKNQFEDKVSVIVPVFNNRKYLKRCLNSLACQTYSNIEVIIIDDGSSDGSGALCEEFCSTHSNFQYYYKSNEGVSVARNYGLSIASGSFLCFVDSDDWISKKRIENMMHIAKNEGVDIVFDDNTVVQNGDIIATETLEYVAVNQCIPKSDITPEMLLQLAGGVCRGIYRRELFEGVKFFDQLALSEDQVANICLLGKAEKIYYVNKPMYYRRIYSESAVYRYRKDLFEERCKGYVLLKRQLKKYWGDDFYSVFEEQFVWRCMEAVLNEFSGKSDTNIHMKYVNIKKICNSRLVQQSLNHSNIIKGRLKWIKNKNCILLYMYGVYWYLRTLIV